MRGAPLRRSLILVLGAVFFLLNGRLPGAFFSLERASANSPPTAVADTYMVALNTPLTVAAPGVLANDTDADGDPLTAVLTRTPTNGTLTLNADGSFLYTPNTDFFGADTFNYVANDGTVNSTLAIVKIIVGDHAPTAADDAYIAVMNTTLHVAAPGVLANDTDADGDRMNAFNETPPRHGTALVNSDGSFTYTPAGGFSGTDSFTYKVNDGITTSNAATVTITVDAPPTATDDSYATIIGTTLNVAAPGVLGNDSDAEGDPLTAVLVSSASQGTVNFNTDGSFSYTPNVGFAGMDSFTYKANDGTADSNTATVKIKVDIPPVANDDSFTVQFNGRAFLGGLLLNDHDADGDALTTTLVTQPAHGTAQFRSNGSFNYTPDTGYYGMDSLTYQANDGVANSNIATVNIRVDRVPVDQDDAYATPANTVLNVNAADGVLSNDSDPDGDPLSAYLVIGTIVGPYHGRVTLNLDGSFTYTPDVGYTGTDTFKYDPSDGSFNATFDATVTIYVGDSTPVAVNDSYATLLNTNLQVPAPGVVSNDVDADGDGLSASLVTPPTHGSVMLNSDGSFSYTPNTDFLGKDSFSYRANDGKVNSHTAMVSIKVDRAPIAADDAYYTNANTPLTISVFDLLANDSDPDGDLLFVMLVSQPSNGTLEASGNGTYTYTPNADFAGVDHFTYAATDGSFESNIVTVTVRVVAIAAPGAAPERNFYTSFPIVLTWSPVDGVIGYEVEVATDSTFAAPLLDVTTSDLSLSIATLDNGQYYWRIRTEVSTNAWGRWRTVDRFTVAR